MKEARLSHVIRSRDRRHHAALHDPREPRRPRGGDTFAVDQTPVTQGRSFNVTAFPTVISLKPGETRTVTFTLDKETLSAWDEASHAWKLYPGTYVAHVGSSSRDLRLKGSFAIAER